MDTYSIIIAEDEALTQERICTLLKKYPQFHIKALASHGEEALESIRLHKPDVVFLDIKMPLFNGFEVLQQLDRNCFQVLVCITAYDEYALEAFEFEALDYLLKPFNEERFNKLIERVKKALLPSQSKDTSFLLVKEAGELRKIDTKDIVYLKADNNYVHIQLEERSYKKRITLSKLLPTLGPSFYRIHRSYIINARKIVRMKHIQHGDYFFYMTTGKPIPSSHTYRKEVHLLTH